jgi:triphosphoribosyl-dephospho-CoA synthetase
MQLAKEGYKALSDNWLPYYKSVRSDAYGMQKTLLRIMSELDDTCVIHRVGYGRAQEVKVEAKELLKDFDEQGLKDLCDRYAREGVSPGGAADMLALTVFINSLLIL